MSSGVFFVAVLRLESDFTVSAFEATEFFLIFVVFSLVIPAWG